MRLALPVSLLTATVFGSASGYSSGSMLTFAPTSAPVDPEYPFCDGRIASIRNGECTKINNTEYCGYDGGDCCECDCDADDCDGPFDCQDPFSDCFGTITDDEEAPVGAIVGGTIGGVVAVGAIIMAVLYKSGRLKKRGSPSNDTAGGSAPTSTQYPVAGSASASRAPPHGNVSSGAAPSVGQLPTAAQYPEMT